MHTVHRHHPFLLLLPITLPLCLHGGKGKSDHEFMLGRIGSIFYVSSVKQPSTKQLKIVIIGQWIGILHSQQNCLKNDKEN